MKKFLGCSILSLAAFASPVWADSNATGGGAVESETVNLGAGPFNHGAGLGSLDNSVLTGVNFTGGFTANQVRFTGTANSLISATWAEEVRMQITDDNIFTPTSYVFVAGSGQVFGTFDYDLSTSITSSWAGGVDPGAAGPWRIEFFDSFDDGAGADAESVNVSMTFENVQPVDDSNGNFSFGAINSSGTVSSVGELALANLFDTYTFSLGIDGTLDISTEFEDVFTGLLLDTEIALFDGAGNLLAQDDDSGTGTYSALNGLFLSAGDYTLVVAGWDTVFADGFSVTPGASTGDYRVNLSFTAIPEPSTFAILGLAAVGFSALRRRRA